MPEKKRPLWKSITGYVAFGVFALVVALLLTFPYDAARQRAQLEADAAGLHLRIGSMGPGLLALRMSDVKVSRKMGPHEEKAPEPLVIKSANIRPTLFPPGVSVSASLLGGDATARLGGTSATSVRLALDELNLADPSLKAATGLDMAGTVSGELELRIPHASLTAGSRPEPDLGQADGALTLELRQATINGGTIHIPIPPYPDPTPVDLPRIPLGNIDGKLRFEKGTGTIDTFTSKSDQIEIRGSGTVKLAKRVDYSEPNVEVKLCLSEEFKKNLGMVAMGLSALAPDPKDPKCRVGRLTGYLGRPAFR